MYNTRSGVARGEATGAVAPQTFLVNFPINLRRYVLLGCRVKKFNIGVRPVAILMIVRFLTSLRWLQTCTLWLQMRLHCQMTTAYSSGKTAHPPTPPPPTNILATPPTLSAHHVNNLKRNHIRGRLVRGRLEYSERTVGWWSGRQHVSRDKST